MTHLHCAHTAPYDKFMGDALKSKLAHDARRLKNPNLGIFPSQSDSRGSG